MPAVFKLEREEKLLLSNGIHKQAFLVVLETCARQVLTQNFKK